MARYVVVEFARNADADVFISQMNEATQQGLLQRVAGVFVKPTKTCDCWNWQNANWRENKEKHGFAGGVERGAKFGWWVCTSCGRPRKGGHQLVNQVLPSELHPEIMGSREWEMTVTDLSCTSIHTNNIDRPKKLRKVRKLWRAVSSS